MNASIKRWSPVAAVVLAGVIVVIFLRSREPVHEGRKLGAWLSDLGSSTPETQERAEAALRALGDEATPFLIADLTRRDSIIKERLYAVARMQRWFDVSYTPALVYRNRAIRAFKTLGADAHAAVPLLEELLYESDEQRVIAETLVAIGGEAVPVLVEALNADDPFVRTAAMMELSYSSHAAEVLREHYLTALNDPHPSVRFVAARCLFKTPVEAERAVPILEFRLQDSSRLVRRYAAHALGAYQHQAEAALPALMKASEDEDGQVRKAVTNAIDRIEGVRSERYRRWKQKQRERERKSIERGSE